MKQTQVADPIIDLGIDNCFASKHWTVPEDWCRLIADLGLTYIEASADTECDPLYMGAEYTKDWVEQVQTACDKTGVRIANLYSGHGTYATLGLSHWDARVRARFRDGWLKKQADTAQALRAGLGFFAHAFDEQVLQNPELYAQTWETLCADLADIACHAKEIGMEYIGVEQMYAPHQVPWTIDGAKQMLRRIYEIGGANFYLTDDVGHMNGQQFFPKPTEERILEQIAGVRKNGGSQRIWMGSRCAMEWFKRAVDRTCTEAEAVTEILKEAERYPYLFAQERDGSVYAWLEETACYSPIIHLQQSDGKSSPHWPFDEAHNHKGIISGEKLLRAIETSFRQPEEAGMPAKVGRIVLTLEPFIGTAGNIYDAISELRETVAYWRRYIPQDGLRLSELTAKLEKNSGAM